MWEMVELILILERAQHILSVTARVVNSFSFAGHMVWVAVTHCHYSTHQCCVKATLGIAYRSRDGCVPINLYLPKQAIGQF